MLVTTISGDSAPGTRRTTAGITSGGEAVRVLGVTTEAVGRMPYGLLARALVTRSLLDDAGAWPLVLTSRDLIDERLEIAGGEREIEDLAGIAGQAIQKGRNASLPLCDGRRAARRDGEAAVDHDRAAVAVRA